MVANAGMNTVTLGNSPLNNYVDRLISENGGGYAFANGSANVGVAAAEFAGGLAALRYARGASAAAQRGQQVASAMRRAEQVIARYDQMAQLRDDLRLAIQAERNVIRAMEMRNRLTTLLEDMNAMRGAWIGGRPFPP